MDPIDVFRDWHRAATAAAALAQPNAVCLSTVDHDGSPQARMVDLKLIRDGQFVFTTSVASPKSVHIASNRNVALTFWWDHVQRQVRVAGVALRLSDAEADEIFGGRSRDARLASWAFQQSAPFPAGATRESLYASVAGRLESTDVARPPDWGALLGRGGWYARRHTLIGPGHSVFQGYWESVGTCSCRIRRTIADLGGL